MRSSIFLAGLFLVVCTRSGLGQCNATALRMQATNGPIDDLQQQLKSASLKVSAESGNYYTRQFDGQTIGVDLMGDRLNPQDLPKLTLELTGFRFKIDLRSIHVRTVAGGTCIGSLAFEVSRFWQVKVTAAEKIALAVKSENSARAEGTETVVPAKELDWATTLRLDVYPAPGSMRHYDVELRAAELSRATSCGQQRAMCHDKKEIYQRLLNAELGSNNRPKNDVYGTVAEQILKRELQSAPVVNGIIFALQP